MSIHLPPEGRSRFLIQMNKKQKELAGDYVGIIPKIVAYMHDGSDEALSNGMMGLIKAAFTFKPDSGTFYNYAHRMIKWEIMEGWRKKKPIPCLDKDFDISTHSRTNSPSYRIELKDEVDFLLGLLPEDKQKTIRIHYNGMDFTKIGKIQKRSGSAVGQEVRYCIRFLRKYRGIGKRFEDKKEKCRFPSCKNVVSRKGLCNGHYRWKNSEDIEKRKEFEKYQKPKRNLKSLIK